LSPQTATPPVESTGSTWIFFVGVFAVTWTCFITVAVAIPTRTPLGVLLVLTGAYAPSLVALALLARSQGMDGVRELLGRVLRWRVAGRWYAFAAGYFVAIRLTVAVLHRLITGAWPRFGDSPWYLIPFAVAFSTPFQAGEEIGWRGYALPRLAARWGLAPASLALGLIWAVWHVPQFFIRWGDSYGQSFPVFALGVVALSVTLAWLWARTGGSLLLPMLLHSAVNNSMDIVPAAVPGATHVFGFGASLVAWLSVALLWIGAAYGLASMRGWGRDPSEWRARGSRDPRPW
jgi:membrane protease YdiL (CAAX protease family)